MPLPIHQSMKDYLTTTEGITSKSLSLPLAEANAGCNCQSQVQILILACHGCLEFNHAWAENNVMMEYAPEKSYLYFLCLYTWELRLFYRSYHRFFQVGDKILVHLAARWSCQLYVWNWSFCWLKCTFSPITKTLCQVWSCDHTAEDPFTKD